MINRIMMLAAMAALIMAAGAVQAGGDPAKGKELAYDCVDCHGEDGRGDDTTPNIAGLDETYHVEQLQAFKTGERTDEDEMMLLYTEELSDQDMADLAAYYATLEGG